MIVLQILFWLSLAFLLHTYVFYPVILGVLAKNKKQNGLVYQIDDEDLPTLSILLAAYNEEAVIEEKIVRTFKTTYPLDKIEFIIGSDASKDNTDAIIKKYQEKYPQLELKVFPGRTGKAGIINDLATWAKNEIFIMTDANVFFCEDTLYNLVKHYKQDKIALVGGNIVNERVKTDGISVQEKTYLDRENIVKFQEGITWGAMIGAFGGVYSIRKSFYAPVPPKFFMDDFYITMNVLENGGHAINELDAICHEDVSNKISEEFRRKFRISIGNFQNLGRYKGLLWPPFKGVAFAFFSHKVLRWYGPFFILMALGLSAYLSVESEFYLLLFLGQIGLMLLPVLDSLLKKSKIHLAPLRFISHFYLMNLALLMGFFKYVAGVKSNIWTPTQRFQ